MAAEAKRQPPTPAEAPKTMAVLRFEGAMFEQLLEIFAEMHAGSPSMSAFEYSEERVKRMLAAAIENPAHVCGFACVDFTSGTIIGIVIASVGRAYFSDEPIATEVVLYMRPESRNEFVLKQLVDAYVAWAKRAEIKKIFLTGMSGVIPDKMLKSMKTLEWKVIGQQMMRELE